jgi:predicted metalloprotease
MRHDTPTAARRMPTVAAVVLAAAIAACGGDDGDAPTPPDPETMQDDPTYDEVLEFAVADLPTFWAREMPRVFGEPYDDVADVVPFDSGIIEGGEVSECTVGVPYEQMPDALYCPGDDVIAYDDEEFFPDLYDDLGFFVPALVLAHEWGHAIQVRTLTDQQVTTTDAVLIETQVDCYTGSWMGDVAQRDASVRLDDQDLDTSVAGLLEFRDPVGLVDPMGEDAHGNAFDRVGAFQEGYDGGVERCADWLADPPPITEGLFTDPEEIARGGDLPYEETLDVATIALDLYWSSAIDGFEPPAGPVSYDPDATRLAPCPSLDLDPGQPDAYRDRVYSCPDDNTVYVDEALTRDVHDRIGDFAVAILVSNAWASAVQEHLGLGDGPTATALQADCLSGSWTGSLPVVQADETVVAARGGALEFDYDDRSRLSPGNLDEVVEAFLILDDPSTTQGARDATTLDRIAAFRTGFLEQDPERACAG